MKKTFFKEEQYFSNPGLWIFVTVVFTISLAPTILALYSQLELGKPLGDSPMSTSGLVILLVLFILMFIGTILLFKKMKLNTNRFKTKQRSHVEWIFMAPDQHSRFLDFNSARVK